MEEHSEEQGRVVPIEWAIPPNIITRVASNVIVQHTAEEFLISFFEIVPPPFIGTDEEIAEQYAQISSVRATCVARVLVTPARMEQFIHVMEENLNRWKASYGVE